MKVGGAIAIGIGGVSSALAVKDVCMTGTEEACKKMMVTEGSKFTGATVGGIGGQGWGAS